MIDFIVDLNDNFKNNPWNRLEFMAIRLSKTYKSQDILDFHNDFIQNVDKNINELIQRIPENTLDFYTVLSPHYAYSSSFGDKERQHLNLISIPSIFYGSSIKTTYDESNAWC